MYTHETNIRVRYAETDKMGYLYYGNYAQYYEVGRVEAIRSLGLSYKELEDSGISMPVLELQSTFVRPAHYDELLTVNTTITELPKVRMFFSYEINNEAGDTINYGKTTLIFFDIVRRKPCRAPEHLVEKLRPFFNL
jgi:acyl-CoA thioester hydrolase